MQISVVFAYISILVPVLSLGPLVLFRGVVLAGTNFSVTLDRLMCGWEWALSINNKMFLFHFTIHFLIKLIFYKKTVYHGFFIYPVHYKQCFCLNLFGTTFSITNRAIVFPWTGYYLKIIDKKI